MKRQIKVMIAYLLILFLSTLFFDGIVLEKDRSFLYNGKSVNLVNPVMLMTIVGGLVSLYLTLPRGPFLVFLFSYTLLVFLRPLLDFISEKIGTVDVLGHILHFEQIIPNFYYLITRLTTPIPFILFWMIHLLFSDWSKLSQGKSI